MRRYVTDYFLYRWRFLLGYGVIGVVVLGLLFIAGFYIPGGLSQDEMASVVRSNALSLAHFSPEAIINIPYQILQRISIELFGVSNISIKLPSLILGGFSIVGMFLLLRSWFKPNVAVLTTILVITTGPFLYVTQSGTTSIMYVFSSVWLLVSATMISRKAKGLGLWKLVLCAVAAISLYTPLSLYILLALASAAALHPHLRYLIRKLSRTKMAIAVFCALLLTVPLIYFIYRQPSIGLTLLGIPSAWPDFKDSIMEIVHLYFDFVTPTSGVLINPVYGLGSMFLIALGLYRLFSTKYTARSYIITAWTVLLLPIVLFNPGYITITFLPAILLMAMGINVLLSSWYRMFPKNPYARIAGIVPLVILIGGMVVSGVDRYMFGYHYNKSTASNFSRDLSLINDELGKDNRGPITVLATEQQKPFYEVVAAHNKDVNVQTNRPTKAATVVATRDAKDKINSEIPTMVLTDYMAEQGDRFYIYKIQ